MHEYGDYDDDRDSDVDSDVSNVLFFCFFGEVWEMLPNAPSELMFWCSGPCWTPAKLFTH